MASEWPYVDLWVTSEGVVRLQSLNLHIGFSDDFPLQPGLQRIRAVFHSNRISAIAGAQVRLYTRRPSDPSTQITLFAGVVVNRDTSTRAGGYSRVSIEAVSTMGAALDDEEYEHIDDEPVYVVDAIERLLGEGTLKGSVRHSLGVLRSINYPKYKQTRGKILYDLAATNPYATSSNFWDIGGKSQYGAYGLQDFISPPADIVIPEYREGTFELEDVDRTIKYVTQTCWDGTFNNRTQTSTYRYFTPIARNFQPGSTISFTVAAADTDYNHKPQPQYSLSLTGVSGGFNLADVTLSSFTVTAGSIKVVLAFLKTTPVQAGTYTNINMIMTWGKYTFVDFDDDDAHIVQASAGGVGVGQVHKYHVRRALPALHRHDANLNCARIVARYKNGVVKRAVSVSLAGDTASKYMPYPGPVAPMTVGTQLALPYGYPIRGPQTLATVDRIRYAEYSWQVSAQPYVRFVMGG